MTEEAAHAPKECMCETCKRKKGLPNGVRSGSIHGYSSQPNGGWRQRTTRQEREAIEAGDHVVVLGVELETVTPVFRWTELTGRPDLRSLPWEATAAERREYERQLASYEAWQQRNQERYARAQRKFSEAGNVAADEAVSLALPMGFWHAKHDGSVTGPEFCSQPASLAYWRAQMENVTAMFTSLLHGGMRSHDGDTAGLHININTSGFEDAMHLERFAALVTHNPRWSTRMAQRTNSSVRDWCRFESFLTTPAYRLEWANMVFEEGYADNPRYSVLNANNRGRIEFRLPRGTLRVDRFYAKLEWTAAMIEYTRDPDNKPIVPDFIRWADTRKAEWPYLVEFMRERFAGRFAAEGGA